MTYILAIFRSRSQAVDCNIRLKSFSVAAELINTPKEANIGCGLSIKIPHNEMQFERAKSIIKKANYSAFYGYFVIQQTFGRLQLGKWG